MSVFPARTARRPTYADVEALPEGLNGEILGGELVVSPRPAGAHAHTSTVLVALLVSAFQLGRGGPGGWWFQHEPELSLDVDLRLRPCHSRPSGLAAVHPAHPDQRHSAHLCARLDLRDHLSEYGPA